MYLESGVQQEKAMVPEIVADGRAGFVVRRHVGKIVVLANASPDEVEPMPPVM